MSLLFYCVLFLFLFFFNVVFPSTHEKRKSKGKNLHTCFMMLLNLMQKSEKMNSPLCKWKVTYSSQSPPAKKENNIAHAAL